MNRRFLQNLATTCEHSSGQSQAACSDILKAYSTEGVDPRNVRTSTVLVKVLVEVAKRLVGLGSSIGTGVGIVLGGTSTAVEITDVEVESIPLSRRRQACVRDMSLLEPARFVDLVSGKASRADKIIALLSTD